MKDEYKRAEDYFGTSCAHCGGLAVAAPVLTPVNYVRKDGELESLCDDDQLEQVSEQMYGDIFYCQDCKSTCLILPSDTPELRAKRMHD